MISLNGPIIYKLIFEAASLVELLENPSQICIVRIFYEAKLSAIQHVIDDFLRITLTKLFDRSVDFRIFNLTIFIFFVSGPDSLPWQLAY